jgi:nitrate reductase NapAB chaperone NapD
MKILFDDSSYIELKKSDGKIIIVIQAKDQLNSLKKITNAVELTKEEFEKLISDI